MTSPIDVELARRDRDLAVGDDVRLAGAETVLGAGLFEAGDPGGALASFTRAEDAYRRVGRVREVGISGLNRARTLSALGRGTEAAALYTDVATDPELAELAWHGLYEHHEAAGDPVSAEAALLRVREAAAAGGGGPVRLAELDAALGRRRLDQGDAAGAMARLVCARDGYVAAGQTRPAADIAVLLGLAHHGLGDPNAAAAAFTAAAERYRAVGDEAAAARCVANVRTVTGSG